MTSALMLDIDGCLNSTRWFASGKAVESTRSGHIDPAAVALVNEILSRTGAVVVISSTWRLYMDLPELAKLLERRGFTGRIIGKTPNLTERATGKLYRSVPRWREIHAWLGAHPSVKRFAIIDDDADAEIAGHFVRTDFDFGIQREHVERAVAMLAEPAEVHAP